MRALSIILSTNVRIENVNFANCLVPCLTYINSRSQYQMRYVSIWSHWICRAPMHPSVRCAAYYTVSFQVEIFYGFQDAVSVVDRRNKCNQDEAAVRRRDFGAFRRRQHLSATCRMMVMPTPPRPPSPSPSPPYRGEINSRDGHRHLPPLSIPFRARAQCSQFQSGKRTSFIRRTRIRVYRRNNSATSRENQFANRSVRICVGLTGVGSDSRPS